jgi:hypothetical protein
MQLTPSIKVKPETKEMDLMSKEDLFSTAMRLECYANWLFEREGELIAFE